MVMHDGRSTLNPEAEKTNAEGDEISPSASSKDRTESPASVEREKSQVLCELEPQRAPTFHRDITFADEIGPRGSTESQPPIPQQLSTEQHIAFLENQRNPKDKISLRIPGPRDFDRGDVPKNVEQDEDGGGIAPTVTYPTQNAAGALNGAQENTKAAQWASNFDADDHPVRRNITIDEATHPRLRRGTGRSSGPNLRNNGAIDRGKTAQPSFDMARSSVRPSRAATFSSLRTSQSKERDPMPYLSYQPTIGRNSAFVDLTEEQREELGGVEYRSLKTLAIVLVCTLTCPTSGFCEG